MSYYRIFMILIINILFILTHLSAERIPISNIYQLANIGKIPEYPLTGEYELTNDIDATVTREWTDDDGEGFQPIGPYTQGFNGKFYGNGYKIYNLYIKRISSSYLGLFGEIGNTGEIYDLGLEDCYIVGLSPLGGICGICLGKITNCYTTGYIYGTSNQGTGGIAGAISSSSVISKCYSLADVFGNSKIGGIIGLCEGNINKCYFLGTVQGNGNEIGGIIGKFGYEDDKSLTCENCFNMGTVRGSESVGGLIGFLVPTDKVVNCYSMGRVIGKNPLMVGGLIGYGTSSNLVTSSYWDIETSGQTTSAGGVGKTTAQMKQKATFTGWDFTNIWDIIEGSSYPFLRGFLYYPKLVILGDSELIVECSYPYNEPGATAYDIPDGDLTNQIQITHNIDINTPGTYIVTYSVTDSNSHTTTKTRTVRIVDTTPPQLSLNGDNPYVLILDETFEDPGITTSDLCDTEVEITINSNVDNSTIGAYEIVYRVTDDSSNLSEVTRAVWVVGKIETVIDLQNIGNIPRFPLYGIYRLVGNIDAYETRNWNEGKGFQPIGTGSNPFAGKLLGFGHTISNLYINRANESNIGIFGFTAQSASITDVVIQNSYIVGDSYVGTIAGENQGSIIRCGGVNYVRGTTLYTGGLVGHNIGNLIKNYTMGEVQGNIFVGGISGYNGFIGTVIDCFSLANIQGYSYVGGLIGANYAEVRNSYSAGLVTGNSLIGGLIGESAEWAVITSCYWDIESSGQSNSRGGIGKTTAEMRKQETFEDWDFENTWNIVEDVTYPFLRTHQYAPILKLLGDKSITLECKSEYIEAGAVAYDFPDGDLTDFIEITTNLNTSVPGNYTVEYIVVDSSNNVTTETRYITVQDTISPEISLLGDNSVFIPLGAIYQDAGATATDSCDGELSPQIIFNNVNTAIPGKYTVVYEAVDGSNNSAQITRDVYVCLEISTIQEFQKIGTEYPRDGVYIITQDIDAEETRTWNNGKGFTPIGKFASPFIGIIFGNHHRIRNLYINQPGFNYISLFGRTGPSAEIRDLGIENASITGGNYYVAGLVAYNEGTIAGCYTTGTIQGGNTIGGLVAFNGEKNITNSYSTANVTGTGNVGGLIGYNARGNIRYCYSAGRVIGNNYVGGLIGYNNMGTVTSCYWDTETSGQSNSSGGIGKTTVEMKQQSTYVNWDFENIWFIIENEMYPIFRKFTYPPQITLIGESEITLECGSEYVELGATAYDIPDGDLTSYIQITGEVNTSKPGQYAVEYSVTDSSNATTTVIRAVRIVDTTLPTLIVYSEPLIILECQSDFVPPNAEANDSCDEEVQVEISGNVNTQSPGEYLLTYSATDSSQNTSSQVITVRVVDTTPPSLTLLGDNPLIVECNTLFIDPGIRAEDDCDGDLNSQVQVDSNVDISVLGEYSIQYTVSDLSNNTSRVMRTVQVVDRTPPVITVETPNPLTIYLHESFEPPQASAEDLCVGTVNVAVIFNNVNPEVIGNYQVIYRASDNQGNNSEYVLEVIVVESQDGEGTAEGEGEKPPHSADQNQDGKINLGELLRVIQFFNMQGYHCAVEGEISEDGYIPGYEGDKNCQPHASDYNPQDWKINLGELLRLIQFFNMNGYYPCEFSEDGYCPGTPPLPKGAL